MMLYSAGIHCGNHRSATILSPYMAFIPEAEIDLRQLNLPLHSSQPDGAALAANMDTAPDGAVLLVIEVVRAVRRVASVAGVTARDVSTPVFTSDCEASSTKPR